MLSPDQINHFNTKGYLVVEELVDQVTLSAIRGEYKVRVDDLYHDWFNQGLVDVTPEKLGFWEKLDQGYLNDLDVHQPLNLSLPHGNVEYDSPMHSGPAVFDFPPNGFKPPAFSRFASANLSLIFSPEF